MKLNACPKVTTPLDPNVQRYQVNFPFLGAKQLTKQHTGDATGCADLFQASVYGRRNFGPAHIAAALAYGWHDVTTNRTQLDVSAITSTRWVPRDILRSVRWRGSRRLPHHLSALW
ncbi:MULTISPECIES: hypothetical protein [unclassified Bradyrhizobium]